jgi:hypothetical protein
MNGCGQSGAARLNRRIGLTDVEAESYQQTTAKSVQ